MAGLGYRNWSAGDVPTADQFDRYLQEQVVGVYTDAADRDTQLAIVKAEGMVAYLKDTNSFTFYTGAAWVTVWTQGQLTNWTPTVHQNAGDIGHTTTHATWSRQGREVTARFAISMTATGNANTEVLIGFAGLPASRFTFGAVGQGYLYDANLDDYYPFIATLATSNTFSLTSSADNGVADLRLGKASFLTALASGDIITGTFCYEANTD